MPLQIGQRVDHGFDEPLGLLSDCHRRIEHFLRVLVTVATDVAGGPLTAASRSALESALKYFAMAAPKHTADEEVSLFPRLRERGGAALAQALASLDRLEHDHDEAEAHHAAVDELVRQWLANDRLPETDTVRLRDHLTSLRWLYQEHIRVEDEEVLPAAARVLDRGQIEEIGSEMAARRHVRPAVELRAQFHR